jgi:hypothetical protein
MDAINLLSIAVFAALVAIAVRFLSESDRDA